MEPKNLQIKHRGWHEVTLTGDLLTGDTLRVKDWIKTYLRGHWDADRRGWIVDLDAVAKYATDNGTTLMIR